MKTTETVAWNNTHSPNTVDNLTTEPERDDGIYMQLFAVKNGVRYDIKVVSMSEIALTLTNSLMDGIDKIVK